MGEGSEEGKRRGRSERSFTSFFLHLLSSGGRIQVMWKEGFCEAEGAKKSRASAAPLFGT